MAKIDGSAKGGVIVPICQQFELPVKLMGVGHKLGDMAVFNSKELIRVLLDEQ